MEKMRRLIALDKGIFQPPSPPAQKCGELFTFRTRPNRYTLAACEQRYIRPHSMAKYHPQCGLTSHVRSHFMSRINLTLST